MGLKVLKSLQVRALAHFDLLQRCRRATVSLLHRYKKSKWGSALRAFAKIHARSRIYVSKNCMCCTLSWTRVACYKRHSRSPVAERAPPSYSIVLADGLKENGRKKLDTVLSCLSVSNILTLFVVKFTIQFIIILYSNDLKFYKYRDWK